MIWNKKIENIKDLEIQPQILKECYNFMMIGRILLPTKHLFGLINGILEKDKIDG